MPFVVRAAVALLSGIGARLLGFFAVWRVLVGTAFDSVTDPTNTTPWLLIGIFLPGVTTSALVFRADSRATSHKAPATT